MQTRIREFRKLRGLTLKELADKIGTTPQTVQRLETANMTVSTDWLEKIAAALNVEPADLIARSPGREIPVLGKVARHGRLHASDGSQPRTLHLHVPADDPVAAQLDERVGVFEAGTILIANRLRVADHANAHSSDCLVGLEDGPVLFRRVIRGEGTTWTLVPHEFGGDVQYNQTVSWLARLVMCVRYL